MNEFVGMMVMMVITLFFLPALSSFCVSSSEILTPARAPPGGQAEAQCQRPGDVLLTQKQTAEAEQRAAAEGTRL